MNSNNSKEANEIINTLNTGSFSCQCPCGCGEEINLKDAGLFYLEEFTPLAWEQYQLMQQELKRARASLAKKKENKASHTKSINFGFISEKIITAIDNFRFNHSDFRSLYKPIDFIIFEGLTRNGNVTKIIFCEIKTGRSTLSTSQKQIKRLIEENKIEFKTY